MNEIKGFTPVSDLLVREHDLLTAVVYGKIWRYYDAYGNCSASIQRMAEELSVSEQTIRRRIQTLEDGDYITIVRRPGLTSILIPTTKIAYQTTVKEVTPSRESGVAPPEIETPSRESEDPLQRVRGTPSRESGEETNKETKESLSPQKNTANASASESHRAEIERATFEVENSELGVDLPEGLEVGTVKRAWEDCKRLLGWHNLDPIPIGKNLDTIVHWLTHGATGDDLAEAVEWHRDQGYRINHLDRLTNSVMRAKGKRIEAEKESRKYSVGELAN